MIHFEYCPILGLRYWEFKNESYADKRSLSNYHSNTTNGNRNNERNRNNGTNRTTNK